jgi:hypothetical protein
MVVEKTTGVSNRVVLKTKQVVVLNRKQHKNFNQKLTGKQ